MFRRRSTLQRVDRESGLAFAWRLPLSSTGSFVLAVILVALVSGALAVAVKVKVGDDREIEKGRASVTVVPSDAEGGSILRQVVEAGPFPFGFELESDPGFNALREAAMAGVDANAIGYRAELAPMPEVANGDVRRKSLGVAVLPPLPEEGAIHVPEGSRTVKVGVRAFGGQQGPRFQHAKLSIPAREASQWVGGRYLVSYGSDGVVTDVVPLNPGEERTECMGWIFRGRVAGSVEEAGSLVVEIVLEG